MKFYSFMLALVIVLPMHVRADDDPLKKAQDGVNSLLEGAKGAAKEGKDLGAQALDGVEGAAKKVEKKAQEARRWLTGEKTWVEHVDDFTEEVTDPDEYVKAMDDAKETDWDSVPAIKAYAARHWPKAVAPLYVGLSLLTKRRIPAVVLPTTGVFSWKYGRKAYRNYTNN